MRTKERFERGWPRGGGYANAASSQAHVTTEGDMFCPWFGCYVERGWLYPGAGLGGRGGGWP